MTIGHRIWAGTGLGILAATLATPAMMSFQVSRVTLEGLVETLLSGLFLLTIFAGPGALVLSMIHAAQMERWAPKARTVSQIRRVGILLGIPLGVVNLVLVLTIVALCFGQDPQRFLLAPNFLLYLIPAAAGGAGLGWGVTLGLKPGPPAHRRRNP